MLYIPLKSICKTEIEYTVNDLAVIKVSVPEKTKYLNISSGSKFGEDIKVYGFPLTNKLGSGLKVTKGIVSSLNGPGNNYSLIQIDAPIQPGNSGGPILNKNGNLVGVAVSSISTPLMISDTTIIPQNINFGVKSETLSNFLKANNIKFNSNDKPIEESDNLALQSTVQLNCYNTLREARKLKEQGLVRNILED